MSRRRQKIEADPVARFVDGTITGVNDSLDTDIRETPAQAFMKNATNAEALELHESGNTSMYGGKAY